MSDSPVLRHSQEVEDFNVGDAKVQHYGLLMKKPFGHKSGRWQKRFVGSVAANPRPFFSLVIIITSNELKAG